MTFNLHSCRLLAALGVMNGYCCSRTWASVYIISWTVLRSVVLVVWSFYIISPCAVGTCCNDLTTGVHCEHALWVPLCYTALSVNFYGVTYSSGLVDCSRVLTYIPKTYFLIFYVWRPFRHFVMWSEISDQWINPLGHPIQSNFAIIMWLLWWYNTLVVKFWRSKIFSSRKNASTVDDILLKIDTDMYFS